MHLKLFFFFIIGFSTVKSQTEIKDNILGKWQFVQQNISFNTGETIHDTFLRDGIDLFFKDKENISFELEEEAFALNATYKIKDATLLISNRAYHIFKVDKEELIFKVQNDSLQATYQYKRLKTPTNND
jgi:hypothetical protein